MKQKQLIDKFLKFEENNDLFDIIVKDLPIWALYRFSTYKKILKSKNENIRNAHYKSLKIEKVINSVKNNFNGVLFHNPFCLESADFLLFNHSRRVYNPKENIWEEPYTDEFLRNEKNKRFYIFESAYQGSHKKDIYFNKNVKYLDIIKNLATIYANFKNRSHKLTFEERNKLHFLINKIYDEFDYKLHLNDIVYNIWISKGIYNLLNFIINKTKPKVIYEVSYYDKMKIILNYISHKKDIKTIEFQHGTMGKYHIAYNFIEKRKFSWFPDKLFLWNKYWKKYTRLPISKEDIEIYGNPYRKRMVGYYKDKVNKSEGKIILFISQGPIGEELSKLAIELSENIRSSKYKIIYKLHPGEYPDWRERYPWLKNHKEIEIIDNNQRHLYELFAKSEIQVGVNSTALFEGLEFNLETYILKTDGWEYLENIINEGRALLITNFSDIIRNI